MFGCMCERLNSCPKFRSVDFEGTHCTLAGVCVSAVELSSDKPVYTDSCLRAVIPFMFFLGHKKKHPVNIFTYMCIYVIYVHLYVCIYYIKYIYVIYTFEYSRSYLYSLHT